MNIWLIISRAADVVGVVGFLVSVCTFFTARRIRKSMLAHVESSDYRKAIDQQIGELEAYQAVLVEGTLEEAGDAFFSKLASALENIYIAYETILPKRVLRNTNKLIEFIRNNLSLATRKANKKDIDKCISLLNYTVTELKKEKKII